MTLEHLVPLQYYVPTIYKDVLEIDELVKGEDYLFDILKSILDQEYARMFIQTCDEIGIQRFEQLMEIFANPSIETLEFRKERILTRCNATLPYTTIWLRIYLNSVLGQHNYDLNIDYDRDIITLYGYMLDYSWAKESTDIINQIKPCNMIFINIPTMIDNIGVKYWVDENTWDSNIWNDDNIWTEYRYLDKQETGNYLKQLEHSHHFQSLLNSIGGIRLNNASTSVPTKEVKDDSIYLEIVVPDDVKLLEKVEILDNFGSVLVSTNCYINTPDGTKIVIRLACYTERET